jgi:hypothetical protein
MRHLGLAGHAHKAWRTPQRATVSPIGGPRAALFHLAEIACGHFSGHYFVVRCQKAWFLPAAFPNGASGARAGAYGAHAGNISEC